MKANRGKGWEARLDHQHTIYRADRSAVIFKTHPPTMMARGRLVYKGKGPPDYIGRAGSRPVCFDAKEGHGTRWPFSSLKRHQAVSLEAFAQDPAALVGIVLRLKGRGCWWVDWAQLGPVWWIWHEGNRGEVASLTVEWLELNAREMVGSDWLGAQLPAVCATHHSRGCGCPR